MGAGKDETQRKEPTMLATLRNASPAPAQELEQAVLRVLMVAAASAYLLFAVGRDPGLGAFLSLTAGMIWLGALVLLLVTTLSPRTSPPRHLFSILYDVTAICVGMNIAGPYGAPLYPLLLGVALGNGLRFGSIYLYVATSLGAIGFSLVVLSSPFWRNQVPLSIGLMMGLVFVPLYVALRMQRRDADDTLGVRSESDRLLAHVTGQLRAPLQGITGASDLLRETSLNRMQRDYADTIGRCAGSLVMLVDNVHDYVRMQRGQLQIHGAGFDLHNVLNGTLRTLRPQFEDLRVQLDLLVDPNTPFQLRGDARRLRQVLTNLITDTARKLGPGSIALQVCPVSLSDTRAEVRFELTPHPGGAGIAIWDPTVAAAEEASAPVAGYLSMGLSDIVARQLIAEMGGDFESDADAEPTAPLRFRLPFDLLEVTHAAPNLDQARVLLIADERSPNVRQLKEWMRGWHVRFDLVETASAAFVRAEGEVRRGDPYHAILVDKPLIDIDAHQFAVAMRKTALAANTALLLIAPPEAANRRMELREAGYSALLPTPLDKRLLFNALHAAPELDGTASRHVVRLRSRMDRIRPSGRSRILVAEDNPTSQKFIARVLERAGHEVEVVHNGEEALDALEVGSYDLVVLDMHMPVMDGVQTVKLFRFIHPDRVRLPFVMLTANATPEARIECEAAGIETFLTKPIEAARLAETVNALLASRSRETPERDSHRHRDRAPAVEGLEGPPVLNLATLQEVQNLGYGSDFFYELVQGFIRDGNGVLDKMEDALARHDFDDFRDAGHGLKGNAGSIGAVKLYKSCQQAERMSRDDYELMGTQLTNDIRTEFRRACSALIEYSKQLGNNVRN